MPATLELRVLLEGPLDTLTGLMDDGLRSAGLIPLTEPYTGLGYLHRGGGGGEVTTATMFESTGDDAIVDWVVVEVRYPNDPGRLLLSRSALIQRDGDIVDAEGTSVLSLCVEPGLWHLAVRHRNHLGIMTGSPVEFFSGQFGTVFANPVDLSSPATPAYRESFSRRKMGAHMAMWNGDVTFDGKVKYTGSGNDRDAVLVAVGGATPNNVDTGYVQSDVNLDAVAKYTGNGNDRDAILRTVGGTTPNIVREGYIPKDSLTLRPNVHVMDDLPLVLDTVRSDIDSNTVMVYAIVDTIPLIDVDHIVVGGDPRGGYLRRVVSATVVNDSLTLTTVQANFSEVFASGNMDLTIEPEAPTGRAFYYIEPIPLINSSAATVTIEDIGFNFSGNSLCDVTFGPTGMVAGEFSTRGINIGINYKLKFQGNLHTDSAEWLALRKTIASGVQMVYGVPVYYEVILSAKLAGKIEFYGAVNTETNVGVTLHADLGVAYDQASGFTDINSFSLPTPTLDTEVNDVGLGFKGSLKWTPEVMVKLNGLGGPYFSSGPSVSAQLRATATGDGITHDVKAELKWKTQAGVKMAILDFKPDYAFVYESDPLISFVSPYRLDTNQVTGNRQIAVPGDSLPLPLRVHVDSRLAFRMPFTSVGDTSFYPSRSVPVDFEVLSGGGTLSSTRVYTDLSGKAETHWTLGSQPVHLQRVRAWVRNGIGDTIPLVYDFVADSAELHLEYISGNEQIGEPDSTLTDSLVVRVLDQNDEIVPNIPVRFAVIEGNGEVSDTFLSSDTLGQAKVAFTLGNDSTERNSVLAFLLNAYGDTLPQGKFLFRAYIDPDTMMYAQLSGNYQTGPASTVLPVDLRVQVKSVLGQEPQEDVLVYFQVTSGGGSVSSFGTSTNSDGVASVAWTLGPDLNIRQKVKAWAIDVYGDTLRGGPLEFEACTIICPPTAMDIDGNVYPVVKIGCDCYFQENLRTHHFANGDPISHVGMADLEISFEAATGTGGQPPSLLYNTPHSSEDAIAAHDGFVYNSVAAADPRGLCPAGWHGFGEPEIHRLREYFDIPPSGWLPGEAFLLPSAWPPMQGLTNSTGFSLRPGRFPAGSQGNIINWDAFVTYPGTYNCLYTGLWNNQPNIDQGKLTPGVDFDSGTVHFPGYLPQGFIAFLYCRCVKD